MIIHTCGIKHHISMQKLISNMNYDISDAALCKSRQKCNNDIFNNINSEIITLFPKNKHNNIFAVDGSKFNVPNGFSKYGYMPRNDAEKNCSKSSIVKFLEDLHYKENKYQLMPEWTQVHMHN